MKKEDVRIELTEKSHMDLSNLGMNTVVDLSHLPFTEFTLELPPVGDVSEEFVKELSHQFAHITPYREDKNMRDKWLKDIREDMKKEKINIKTIIKDRTITIQESNSWSFSVKVKEDIFDVKACFESEIDLEKMFESFTFDTNDEKTKEMFNQGGDLTNSIMLNLFATLGTISFLQSDKRDTVKMTSRVDIQGSSKKSKSKSKKKTYIYKKRYVFADDTINIEERHRNYERKLEQWMARGHWRNYKSGKSVWIEEQVKKAKGKVEKPVKQEYKITKVD